MKTQGFTTKVLSFKQAQAIADTLPKELELWGDFANFKILHDKIYTPKVFLVYYFDEVVAGLVFYEKNLMGVGKTGYSPHPNQSVPYAHIYMQKQDSQRAQEQLHEVFVTELSIIVRKQFMSFTLVLPVQFSDVREFLWNKWSVTPRFTYSLPLDPVRSVTLATYVGKKIRNIIKMSGQRFKMKPVSAAEFFTCYDETYKRQNMRTPKDRQFFKQLAKLSNMSLIGAFEKNVLHAGIIVCEVGDTAYFVTSGSLDNFVNSNGVTYLLYKYLEQLLENPEKTAIKHFDFVGANSKRLAYFKSSFQPVVQSYYKASFVRFPLGVIKKLLGIN